MDNAIAGFLTAWRKPSAQGTYNIADCHDVSWNRYLTDPAVVAGTRPPRSMPHAVTRGLAAASDAVWRVGRPRGRRPLSREALQILESRHPIPTRRASDELGIEPHVSYEAGMAGVAEYLETRS